MLEINVITCPILYKKIKPGEEKPAPFLKKGFSTKVHDRLSEDGDGSDLIYYGYRHYSPKLGRFISKDPIEEIGGVNLYAMASNDAVNRYDFLGLVPLRYRIISLSKTSTKSLTNPYSTPDRTINRVPLPFPRTALKHKVKGTPGEKISLKMINHYFNGGGKTFCMTCYTQIAEVALNDKSTKISGKRSIYELDQENHKELNDWLKKQTCNKEGYQDANTDVKFNPPLNNMFNINLGNVAFTIGKSWMHLDWQCEANLICRCCPKGSSKKYVKANGYIKCNYTINMLDRFEDALDALALANGGRGLDEAYGGTPYETLGAWKVTKQEDVNYNETCK